MKIRFCKAGDLALKYNIWFVVVYALCANLYLADFYTVAGLIMMIYSVVQYVYIARARNTLLDLKAIFILTWCMTLGMAMLRLLAYEFKWSSKFLFAEFLGMFVLLIAIDIGAGFFNSTRVEKESDYFDIDRPFSKKLYNFVLFFVGFAFACFVVNYLRTGIIPLFSSNRSAYVEISSKFLALEIGMAPVSGMAYYCLTGKGINNLQKLVMWLCIILNVFVFPILNLSRGNLVANIIMFFASFYFCSPNLRKSLRRIFVVALIAIFFLTAKRDFSALQLATYTPTFLRDKPTLASIFVYLTSSHDNFALNIDNFSNFSHGWGMFEMFNEFLNIQWIEDIVQNSYSSLSRVQLFLNVNDMFGSFYYDLGFFGIFLWDLLWGILWGATEKWFEIENTPVSCMAYGISLYCVGFAFFTDKTGFVSFMWYGMTFLCSVVMHISISHSYNNQLDKL